MSEAVIKFAIDGVDYRFDFRAITPEMARIYRKWAKVSLAAMLDGVEDGDIGSVSALVWAARWQDGERVTPAVVEQQFSDLGAVEEMEIEFMSASVPDEVPDPEALSADSG